MNILQLKYCSGQFKEAKLRPEEDLAKEVWREIADNLMTRKDHPFALAGNSHLVQVSLIVVPDLDPNDPGRTALSVYRWCADIHPQEIEPKLYIAKGRVA